MSKIYTKTGDQGETSLLSGERVTKDCINLRIVGELDELNSVLGIVVSFCYTELVFDKSLKQVKDEIFNIQKNLFKLGSELASLQNFISADNCTEKSTDNENPLVVSAGVKRMGEISIKDTEKLEKQIDSMWAKLPELKNFILPGGSPVGAYLHLARTICRRAERELVSLGKEKKIRAEVYQYLNRLSDFLFTAARFVNYRLGIEEIKI